MILNETEVLDRLSQAKRVLLVEPRYKRKYPPLGLMKIAAFVRAHGGKVKYTRGAMGEKCDLIAVTSLFTYEQRRVYQAIKQSQDLSPGVPIVVGGVFASLQADDLVERTGVDVFKGYSPTLDQVVPDYSIGFKVEDPWNDFSFSFTSRGCPNRCPYCAVWRIEREPFVNPAWRESIVDFKPNAMISDNNLSSTPLDHIVDLVGHLAATRKGVVFDNGVDCKLVTPEMAKLFSRVKFVRAGMRLAFDRIEEDGTFQGAVETLVASGVPKAQIMAYVLFNFRDSPREADYRMRECVRLGIRPYPQKFQELRATTRDNPFVGKLWTKKLANVFRHYWLMAGIYTKHTFDDYLKTQVVAPEDLAAWNVDADAWVGR